MTPIADMVEQMLAAKVADSLIVLAVKAAELSAGQSRGRHADKADARREADRLRKQRARNKTKQNQPKPEANDAGARANSVPDMSRGQSADIADNHCESFFLLEDETPKKESKKQVVTRAKATRITRDAVLSAADRQFAIDNGVRNPDRAWAEFIDYWIAIPGSRGTKLDWSATWRNRVRQVGGGNFGRGTGSPNNTGII